MDDMNKKPSLDELFKQRRMDERLKKLAEDKAKQLTTPVLKDSFASKPDIQIVKGITPVSSGKELQKVTDIKDFWSKIKNKTEKVGNIAGKAVKGMPVLGAIAGGLAALDSNDAAAAIPGLDSAESAGMSADDEKIMLAEEQAMRNYLNSEGSKSREAAMSPEQIKARRQALVKRMKGIE
jgi:hypothetical protein